MNIPITRKITNTSLALLATSLSSPGVLLMTNQFDVNWDNHATIADAAAILAEVGAPVDDTYTGTLTFSVTVHIDALGGGNGSDGFTAFHYWLGETEKLGITAGWGSTNWGAFNYGAGTTEFDGGSGPVPLAVGAEESMVIMIDFVAGGDDTLTVSFRGEDNIYTGDYSFDSIRTRSGNNVADFTYMSMSVGDRDVDTDSDGMPDWWEAIHGLITGVNDSGLDPDVDDLTNLQEYENRTNPQVSDIGADPDGDGIDTPAEINGSANTAFGNESTDPTNPDSDGDGIWDGDETTGALNTFDGAATNPNEPDTDFDTYSDGFESSVGTNPNSAAGPFPTMYTQDFDTFANGTNNLADGSNLQSATGGGYVQDGRLRLSDYGVNNVRAAFRMPALPDAANGWSASFDVFLTHGLMDGNSPADGMSFAWGNLPATGFPNEAEEGWSGVDENISYLIDIYNANNYGDNQPDVGIFDNAQDGEGVLVETEGVVAAPGRGHRATVVCTWKPDPDNAGNSLVSFTTAGLETNAAFTDETSYVSGAAEHIFAIAARTGGSNETMEIDNLVIITGDADSDTDGLPDAWEIAKIGGLTETGTDNNDGDAWDNATELANGTDPALADTDGDLTNDDLDVNPTVADPDLDGIDDTEELSGNSNQYDGLPTLADNPDSDGDGLPDGGEMTGTANTYDGTPLDPNSDDSDGDGFTDPNELAALSDPNDEDSIPELPVPVLYYDFEGVTGNPGDTVPNLGTNGTAGTLQGTAGAIVQDPGAPAPGNVWQGNRVVGGVDGPNDRRIDVNLNTGDALLPFDGGNYTAMAWMRYDGQWGSDDHMVFGIPQNIWSQQIHFGIRDNDGGSGVNSLHMGTWNGDLGDRGTFTPGTWIHVTYVRGANEQGNIYLNGVATGGDALVGLFTAQGLAAPLAIGSAGGNIGNSAFNGAIDEVKIFNRRLSEPEIQILMAYPTSSGGIKIDSVTLNGGNLELSLSNIPDGDFHMEESQDLINFSPLDPAIDFDKNTAMPLLIPVNPAVDGKLFFQAFEGLTPAQ